MRLVEGDRARPASRRREQIVHTEFVVEYPASLVGGGEIRNYLIFRQVRGQGSARRTQGTRHEAHRAEFEHRHLLPGNRTRGTARFGSAPLPERELLFPARFGFSSAFAPNMEFGTSRGQRCGEATSFDRAAGRMLMPDAHAAQDAHAALMPRARAACRTGNPRSRGYGRLEKHAPSPLLHGRTHEHVA
jgi:hypothetical protein